MVVTNVGGLPEIVAHGEVGYVVNTEPKAIAEAICSFYADEKEADFLDGLKERKKLYSWGRMVEGIEGLL